MVNARRRRILQGSAALACAMSFPFSSVAANGYFNRIIPSTSESLHPIGLGSWITFNVGRNQMMRSNSARIIKQFLRSGGQMIDSSPMYGSSEGTIGYGLAEAGYPDNLFAATKTWSGSVSTGKEQFSDSQHLWGLPKFALVQIHNLLAWREQLPMLRELKQRKLIRYIGVTTSHGRRHDELASIIEHQDIDFVQLTYNIADREVEQRLLPAARDKGIAVIANRPFRGGQLFRYVQGKSSPGYMREFGCNDWPSFFLRFILSHPSVTCAIPATSQLQHLNENMAAANQHPLPDEKTRKRMINTVRSL